MISYFHRFFQSFFPYCKNKKVDLSTWTVTNWPDGEEVLVDVLVYKDKVIGGAVYTASVEGFMYGLRPMAEQLKS